MHIYFYIFLLPAFDSYANANANANASDDVDVDADAANGCAGSFAAARLYVNLFEHWHFSALATNCFSLVHVSHARRMRLIKEKVKSFISSFAAAAVCANCAVN